MQVRCVGFRLEEGNTKVPLQAFLGSLSKLSKKPEMLVGEYRILLVHKVATNDFYKGVVFSFHDRKSYLEFVSKAGGSSRIQKKTYENPPVEANFFVVHIKSNKGVYLQYRGSLSALNFGKILGLKYKSFATQTAAIKRIKLKYELLYSRESLNEILDQQLDEISSIEFDASEVYLAQSEFDPSKSVIKSSRVKFGFNAALAKSTTMATIVHFIRTKDLTFGKINGSLNGMARSIDIFENVDLFHVEEFDDLVEYMEAGVDNFQDAAIFNLLLKLVDNDKRIIE